MTQQDHLAQVTQWISQNQQSVGISPNTILQFVDYANQRIWKTVAPTRPTDFRKLYTGLADGTRLPIDWTVYAGSANYTDGGGNVRPFHYIIPEQLGFELNNSLGKAQTYFPALFFEDLLVRTLPAGLSGISMWGFNRPIAMLGASPTTDDGMPPWLSSSVHIEAAEALRELSMDEHKSDETLIRRQKESHDLNAALFEMFGKAMQADVRSTIKQ